MLPPLNETKKHRARKRVIAINITTYKSKVIYCRCMANSGNWSANRSEPMPWQLYVVDDGERSLIRAKASLKCRRSWQYHRKVLLCCQFRSKVSITCLTVGVFLGRTWSTWQLHTLIRLWRSHSTHLKLCSVYIHHEKKILFQR